MGLFTKDIKTMGDLFLHTLEDVYYAELRVDGHGPFDLPQKTPKTPTLCRQG
jgi:hypothetical protein